MNMPSTSDTPVTIHAIRQFAQTGLGLDPATLSQDDVDRIGELIWRLTDYAALQGEARTFVSGVTFFLRGASVVRVDQGRWCGDAP